MSNVPEDLTEWRWAAGKFGLGSARAIPLIDEVERLRELVPGPGVAVIDPDNGQAVQRLAELASRMAFSVGSVRVGGVDQDLMRDVLLRYAAERTPVKPDEPTELGSIVNDANGIQWVRISSNTYGYPWQALNCGAYWSRNWSDFTDDVKVLRVGISEGEA